MKKCTGCRIALLVWISGGIEDAQAEEIEAGAAVHGALDQFQAMHLPFDLSLAPRLVEGLQ
jgi:hypothetical protein